MDQKTYTLRVMSPKDRSAVVDFLSNFFFIDEPLNIETGINLDYKSGKRCPELEEYCISSISEGNSVIAVSPSGQPVGVSINGSISKTCDKNKEDGCPNEKFKKVLILLSTAEKQLNIFDKFPNLEKLLDIKILSVDTNWRNLGLCKSLVGYTKKLAKEQGFQMLKVDCTSQISARAVEKLGFEKIHELKYEKHIDEKTEKPVFNPPAPHFALQVYIYKLKDV